LEYPGFAQPGFFFALFALLTTTLNVAASDWVNFLTHGAEVNGVYANCAFPKVICSKFTGCDPAANGSVRCAGELSNLGNGQMLLKLWLLLFVFG